MLYIWLHTLLFQVDFVLGYTSYSGRLHLGLLFIYKVATLFTWIHFLFGETFNCSGTLPKGIRLKKEKNWQVELYT